jgi:hypothetical protein
LEPLQSFINLKNQYRPHSFWHCRNAFLVAGIGPSIINGSLPTTAPILIIALNPSFSPTFGTNQHNEAPSTSPEELPA